MKRGLSQAEVSAILALYPDRSIRRIAQIVRRDYRTVHRVLIAHGRTPGIDARSVQDAGRIRQRRRVAVEANVRFRPNVQPADRGRQWTCVDGSDTGYGSTAGDALMAWARSVAAQLDAPLHGRAEAQCMSHLRITQANPRRT